MTPDEKILTFDKIEQLVRDYRETREQWRHFAGEICITRQADLLAREKISEAEKELFDGVIRLFPKS